MKKNELGFSLFEVFLLLIFVCFLAGTGYYVWYRHYRSGPLVPTTKPVNNCANEKEMSTNCVNSLNGWKTYKSSHSSITFSYPSSWEVINNKLNGSYELENVSIYGPNNFELDFNLQTNHVNPALSCASVYYGTVVPLNNQFVIVPTLDISNKDNVDTINLMTSTYKDNGKNSGCGLDFSPNPVGKTIGFTFSGAYIKQDNSYGGTYILKPEASYFNLPEVKLAETVFASLRQ